MIKAESIHFTLLTDVFTRREGLLLPPLSVVDLYGGTPESALPFAINITDSDVKDDFEVRTILAGQVPGLKTDNPSLPLTVPPNALRSTVSMVIWTLMRRWSRGHWPFQFLSNRGPRSLREIGRELAIDPGQITRVISGSAMFSLRKLTMFLRHGGYRLAILNGGHSQSVAETILSAQWKNSFRSDTGPIERAAPLPTMIPRAPN